MKRFLIAILCGLKRIERDSVIQMGFLTSVRIKDIRMIGRTSGKTWNSSDLSKTWFLEELEKVVSRKKCER